jgi:hypothetical protein
MNLWSDQYALMIKFEPFDAYIFNAANKNHIFTHTGGNSIWINKHMP